MGSSGFAIPVLKLDSCLCLLIADAPLKLRRNVVMKENLLVSRFPWLVVDEYQDLGGPLHYIVTALVDHGAKVFAVGDPDQTIYDFTGADPKYLVELSRDQTLRRYG